jgi:hypothetical protein
MAHRTYSCTSKVWLYPGMAGWHFLSLPRKESAIIKEKYKSVVRGWGSLPVTVKLGKTKWQTSIFPDKKSGTYLLPLKAAVRKKEEIEADDTVTFALTLRA